MQTLVEELNKRGYQTFQQLADFVKHICPRKAVITNIQKNNAGKYVCYNLTFDDGSRWTTGSKYVIAQLEFLEQFNVSPPFEINVGLIRGVRGNILTLIYPSH